jgi:hypothetical protein
MGPTAAASIGISVSVAKRYGVSARGLAFEPGLNHSLRRQYCLVSNAGEVHLPVMLIWVPYGRVIETARPAAEQVVQIVPCEGTDRPGADVTFAVDGSAAMKQVLVTPE